MGKNYVEVQRNHRLTRNQIEKFPENSVWVDVWHIADSGEGYFSIRIRQSVKNFKSHWQKAKTLGVIRNSYLQSAVTTCGSIAKVLGIPIKNFSLHGSSQGNTERFQKLMREREA